MYILEGTHAWSCGVMDRLMWLWVSRKGRMENMMKQTLQHVWFGG